MRARNKKKSGTLWVFLAGLLFGLFCYFGTLALPFKEKPSKILPSVVLISAVFFIKRVSKRENIEVRERKFLVWVPAGLFLVVFGLFAANSQLVFAFVSMRAITG